MIERAERRRKQLNTLDDPAEREVALQPNPRENRAWEIRRIARRLAEDESTNAELLNALEDGASAIERLDRLEEFESRFERARRAYRDQSIAKVPRIRNALRELGFSRSDRKRGKSIDSRGAADAFDALVNDPEMRSVAFHEPGDEGAAIEVQRDAHSTIEFGVVRIRESKRPAWLVTGCPLDPVQGLEVVQLVFGFASVSAAFRALEAERARVHRIQRDLAPYASDSEIVEFLERLPSFKSLSSARP